MIMNEQIGITAGRVWNYLAENGPTTIIKLKSSLEVSNGHLHLALGWLSREDKIELIEYGNTYKVAHKN
jgi:hypothetical protein